MPTKTNLPRRSHAGPKRSKQKKLKIPKPLLLLLLLALICTGVSLISSQLNPQSQAARLERAKVPSWVDVQLIDVNGTARRGVKLSAVNDIVIHYVGNPGTTAQQNRDYFNQKDTTVSAHFLVGLDGEVIQCIPLNEVSSASNDRNGDTISIEVCHPDATGKFNDASYQSLVKLTAWLCDYCKIDRSAVIRHYDITGKLCPLYFVEHEDAWTQFKTDVANYGK